MKKLMILFLSILMTVSAFSKNIEGVGYGKTAEIKQGIHFEAARPQPVPASRHITG